MCILHLCITNGNGDSNGTKLLSRTMRLQEEGGLRLMLNNARQIVAWTNIALRDFYCRVRCGQSPLRFFVILEEFPKVLYIPFTPRHTLIWVHTDKHRIQYSRGSINLVDGCLEVICFGNFASLLEWIFIVDPTCKQTVVKWRKRLDCWLFNKKHKLAYTTHPVSTLFIKMRLLFAKSSEEVRVNIFSAAFAIFVCGWFGILYR